MNEVLAATLHGLQADMARVDRIGLNLANALTPGYKRAWPLARPFAERLAEAGGAEAMVHVDPRQGTFKATGQGLDLALSGPGWFEVLTPQGPAYTRAGNFRADAQARLVTAEGHPVQGIAGDITLPPGGVFVDSQGRLFEGTPAARTGGEPLAQLKLVRFDDGAPAQRIGPGLLRFGEATPLADYGRTETRQGYLENANVSSVQEMVQLVQTLRHFESLQKAALGYDEMLGQAIRKLGENG